MAYHIENGVDKFFIYDNVGSVGNLRPGSANKTATKKGIDLSCFGFSEEEKVKKFNEIWEDYKEHIVYIPWEPKD